MMNRDEREVMEKLLEIYEREAQQIDQEIVERTLRTLGPRIPIWRRILQLFFGLALAGSWLLAGCGNKHDAAHYSGTGLFTQGTPACGGGDVCRGDR